MSEEELEKAKIKAKVDKMQESKFNQQVLPAFRPVPTFMNTILTFAAVGIVLVAVGIHIQVQSGKIQEFIVQYDRLCGMGEK